MKIQLLLLLLIIPALLWAQGQKKLVQVTGLVVSGQNAMGVPGVAITIPKAGRGVITNQLGYFSMPAMPGDSAIVSAMGFRKQYYKIPEDGRESISIIIHLEDDPILLPEVEIFPYPTEELFKQAFLNLKLPDEDINRMRRNLDEEVLAQMRFDMPMDGSLNHTFFIQQQVLHIENRNSMAALQLTNPFAWARVINAFKRGDYDKNKKKKK
jgi:CarboxypepD_reg-like domain